LKQKFSLSSCVSYVSMCYVFVWIRPERGRTEACSCQTLSGSARRSIGPNRNSQKIQPHRRSRRSTKKSVTFSRSQDSSRKLATPSRQDRNQSFHHVGAAHSQGHPRGPRKLERPLLQNWANGSNVKAVGCDQLMELQCCHTHYVVEQEPEY